MEKTAVVLSGGGSCGAYQIGVWKALRKLKIRYEIVTGVSVGALNGMMMVQNDYFIAYRLWSNIDYNFLFNKFIDSKEKTIQNKDIYLKYVEGFLKNGGMDITNLELAIANVFNSKKFYNSPIDFGIMVYNLTKLKAESLRKSQLTEDKVKDYIIASATCFPAFKIKTIDEQKYIDGGYGDNLPINLAIQMGAKNIIAVDLEQVGIKKKCKNEQVNITYIRPKNDIGSFLIFDKKQAKKNIKYGYNDTLKTYGILKGDKYTFYSLGYDYFCKKMGKKMHMYVERLLKEKENTVLNELKYKTLEKIFQISSVTMEKTVLDCINFLGKAFNMDDTKIYFIYQFHIVLKIELKHTVPANTDLIKKGIKNNEINSLLGSKYVVKYIYENLRRNQEVEFSLLYTIFRREFLAAIYLLCL